MSDVLYAILISSIAMVWMTAPVCSVERIDEQVLPEQYAVAQYVGNQ
jgi:hypothetical protein